MAYRRGLTTQQIKIRIFRITNFEIRCKFNQLKKLNMNQYFQNASQINRSTSPNYQIINEPPYLPQIVYLPVINAPFGDDGYYNQEPVRYPQYPQYPTFEPYNRFSHSSQAISDYGYNHDIRPSYAYGNNVYQGLDTH